MIIVNIYATCDDRRKHELWDELSSRIDENNGESMCVLGDFNVVKVGEERIGSTNNIGREEMKEFNDFIKN